MKKGKINKLNNRGSTLILTLIVFMVILILGTTMITSMLYSQNENNMQINKQKAYYAAQSAADAVKGYFLNPTSTFVNVENITSPYELIGTTGTYTLKEQGIDEETKVVINIKREGTFISDQKEYIVIEAIGNCQGEQSIVKVRLLEEKQMGSDLYSDQVVFGSGYFKLNHSASMPLKVKGNVFIDDISGSDGVNISGIDLTEPNEEGQNTLYVNGINSPVTIQNSKLQDVYVQFTKKGLHMNNNEAENIYVKYTDEENTPWVGISFDENNIRGEAQLYMGSAVPNVVGNKIGQRLILGLDMEELPSWKITGNEVDEIYIKGAKKLGAVQGLASKPIEVLYTDALVYENLPYYYISKIVERDLSELNAYEQKVPAVINNLEKTSEVLREKPSWDKTALSSSFIKLEQGQGPYAQDPANNQYEEYYDPIRKIRLVFAEQIGWHTVQKGGATNEAKWLTYYISNEAAYEEDQVFFIAEQADGITFNCNTNDRLGPFYLYAPRALCKFATDFEYFEGSIIAERIIIEPSVQAEFAFKVPEETEGIGVPGGTSGQSYKYSFVEYLD